MSLLNYFPIIQADTSFAPRKTITEGEVSNHSVLSGKRRGPYSKTSQDDKLTIGKYASENGVAQAVRHFKEKNLKESSVRDWKNLYEKQLKEQIAQALPGEKVVVKA